MLIWQAIEKRCGESPGHVALVSGKLTLTYQDLAERVARLATGLSNTGLSAGDRLAVLLPNSFELVISLLAASTSDLIAVPILPSYPPAHVATILGLTTPSALVTSPELATKIAGVRSAALPRILMTGAKSKSPAFATLEALMESSMAEPPRRRSCLQDPIGFLADTSGTTGCIKIVAHTQARLLERASQFSRTVALGACDEALAIFHLGRPVNFVCLLLAMIQCGGTVSLLDWPEPASTWATYQERRPTYVFVPPGGTQRLFDHPAAEQVDHSRLRFWFTGGDRTSESLRQKVSQVTGKPFLEMYGLTETGALTVNPPEGPIKGGAIGRPMAGVEMRLVDEEGRETGDGEVGRLFVRSRNLMAGYWNDTLSTHRALETGWFDTQDLMKRDGDGYYWFIGRASDVAGDGSRSVKHRCALCDMCGQR